MTGNNTPPIKDRSRTPPPGGLTITLPRSPGSPGSPGSPAKVSIAYNVHIELSNDEHIGLRLFSYSRDNIGTKETKLTPSCTHLLNVSHRMNGDVDEGVHHHVADSLYCTDAIRDIAEEQQQLISDLIVTYFNTLSRIYHYKKRGGNSTPRHDSAYEYDIDNYKNLRKKINNFKKTKRKTEQELQFWADIFAALDNFFEFCDTSSLDFTLLGSAYKRFSKSHIKFGNNLDHELEIPPPPKLITELCTTSTSSRHESFLPRTIIRRQGIKKRANPDQEEEEEEYQQLISPDTVTAADGKFGFNAHQTQPTEPTANNGTLFQDKKQKTKRSRNSTDEDEDELRQDKRQRTEPTANDDNLPPVKDQKTKRSRNSTDEDELELRQDERQRTANQEKKAEKPFDLYGEIPDIDPNQEPLSRLPRYN